MHLGPEIFTPMFCAYVAYIIIFVIIYIVIQLAQYITCLHINYWPQSMEETGPCEKKGQRNLCIPGTSANYLFVTAEYDCWVRKGPTYVRKLKMFSRIAFSAFLHSFLWCYGAVMQFILKLFLPNSIHLGNFVR